MINSKCLVLLATVAGIAFYSPSFGFQEVTESSSSQRYQKYLASIMEIADENKDGKIDRDEADKNYHIVAPNSDMDGDGFITGPELLDAVIGKQSRASNNKKANEKDKKKATRPVKSGRLAVTVLKLPDSYAKSNIISIDDVLRKLSVKSKQDQVKKDVEEIPLLDQFEVQLVDGKQTKMELGSSKTRYTGKVTRNGRTSSSYTNVNVGTTLSVRPKFNGVNDLNLTINLDGDYLVKNERRVREDEDDTESFLEPMFIKLDTELQLDARKPVSAVNMLVGGHHVLVLFKVVDM